MILSTNPTAEANIPVQSVNVKVQVSRHEFEQHPRTKDYIERITELVREVARKATPQGEDVKTFQIWDDSMIDRVSFYSFPFS